MNKYSAAYRLVRSRFWCTPQRGRHRCTFFDGDTVIKVPLRESGEFANEYEVRSWDNEHEPRAKAWVDELLTAETGVTVIRMERVEPCIHKDDLPAWTDFVDGAQVGFTADGRLVAYDWEHC